jgi:hypothetical protein
MKKFSFRSQISDFIVSQQDFLSESLANAASVAFPDEKWQWWHRYGNRDSLKFGSVDHLRFPNACRLALEELGKDFDPIVTNNRRIFADFDYYAGGMHMIPPGGWLSWHLDAEYHPLYNWKRVGSLVWFCNKEWKEEWGGLLKLTDPVDGSETVICPEFNKCVYFETSQCWHQVTQVTGPENRKTMAIFYWEEVDSIPEDAVKSANFSR